MSESARQPAGRAGMLSLAIKERSALFAAYMPYVKGGGLFIPTNRPYQMGDQVYMLLTLMEDPNKLPISARWSGSRHRVRKATVNRVLAYSSMKAKAPPQCAIRSRDCWVMP
jgi:Tfp pilus assembly protein PilZ